MIIAGIGSRGTPQDMLTAITSIGYSMAKDGHVLRSGGAAGADSAFEDGWAQAKRDAFDPDDCPEIGVAEIYVPWYGFNRRTRGVINSQTLKTYGMAANLARQFHPAWDRCSRGAKGLHTRNVYIMLGRDLETPVDVVYCWTPGARVTGGTGQALRMALHFGIRTVNLARQDNWCEDQYLNDELNNAMSNFDLTMSRSS